MRGLPPFTNGEVLRAAALFTPADGLEDYRQAVGADPDGPCIFWVSDGTLLALATMSDALAARVVAYRPELRARVDEVRADPEGYLASLREDEPGAPDAGV